MDKTVISVGIYVTEPDGAVIVDTETSYATTGNPYSTAMGAINAAAGDIARGWAGLPRDGWSDKAKKYDRPGSATVLATVSIGENTESFETTVKTTTSVARAVVQAVHSLADDVNAWIRRPTTFVA
jgi:hypothetical protein